MTLCTNTYRRGAVYWWRGRFTVADASSRTIAFSLRVYDPARARLLGVRLNAEAERLRRRVEAGMVAYDDVGRSLGETLEAGLAEPITWTFSEQAEKALAAFERERIAAELPPPGVVLEPRPTRAQIDRVVAKIADADALDLRRASEHARLQVGFDEAGYVLGIDNEPCADGVMAAVYRMIAYRGAGARLTEEDEAELVRDGRTRADIDTIRVLVREVAADEKREGWRLGPTRETIAKMLVEGGVEPALDTVHAVRRRVLLSRASMLRVFAGQGRADDEVLPPAAAPPTLPPPPDLQHDAVRPERFNPLLTLTGPGETAAEAPALDDDTTFLSLTEDFLTKKKLRMGDHSRRQYRAVARLFVKSAGTHDPLAMKQAHIGKFFDLLPKLPKSHGKSPADEERTLDEIIARGEAAVLKTGRSRAELIGLDPPTIDRYVTQLHALLKYMKGRGFLIGDLETLSEMRERDDEADEDKRRALSEKEEIALFESAPWSGCASEADRCKPGTIIVHDSLYFLPLLAKYELLSLSEAAGIMLDDVDDGAPTPSIEIRINELRKTLKTLTRSRRQAIHPELIRLGFLLYVRQLRSLGFKILFPDLRLRGAATPMTNLFNKIWVPVLDAALPSARSEKKTLHSLRKSGNTVLTAIPTIVAPEVRLQLMGHAQTSVNGKHYVAPFPDVVKLAALQQLIVSTGAVRPANIRLAEAVRVYATKPQASNQLI